MAAKTTSFTVPEELFTAAQARAGLLGYGSFSEYLNFLLLVDTNNRPQHVRTQDGHRMIFTDESGGTDDTALQLVRELVVAVKQATQKASPTRRKSAGPAPSH